MPDRAAKMYPLTALNSSSRMIPKIAPKISGNNFILALLIHSFKLEIHGSRPKRIEKCRAEPGQENFEKSRTDWKRD